MPKAMHKGGKRKSLLGKRNDNPGSDKRKSLLKPKKARSSY